MSIWLTQVSGPDGYSAQYVLRRNRFVFPVDKNQDVTREKGRTSQVVEANPRLSVTSHLLTIGLVWEGPRVVEKYSSRRLSRPVEQRYV